MEYLMDYRFGIFALLLIAPYALADLTAVTGDGRKVTLRDDGSWSFVQVAKDDGDSAPTAQLTLETKKELSRGCRLGLRLQNDLPAQIRTLVLRFTAYKGEQVAFETVSRGYSFIKPTNSQYQEVIFRGIRCDEIRSLGVSAARNCHIGKLTKYSAASERCLELIQVVPSDLLPIAKTDSP